MTYYKTKYKFLKHTYFEIERIYSFEKNLQN